MESKLIVNNIDEIEYCARYHQGIAAWKNVHDEYISATTLAANLVGYQKSMQIVGEKDFNLPCKASENADKYISFDDKVKKSLKSIHSICFNQYVDDSWHILFSQRVPVLTPNAELVGVALLVQDITNISILNMGVLLSEFMHEKISKCKPAHVLLQETYEQFPLSRQESKVLFCVVHGYSYKKISTILNISVKTIETYIYRIKIKLSCNSKSQLIEKLYTLNLLNVFLL